MTEDEIQEEILSALVMAKSIGMPNKAAFQMVAEAEKYWRSLTPEAFDAIRNKCALDGGIANSALVHSTRTAVGMLTKQGL